jgi:hypothetical protein
MKKIAVLSWLVLLSFFLYHSTLNARDVNHYVMHVDHSQSHLKTEAYSSWLNLGKAENNYSAGGSTFTLTVESSPNPNVYIAVSPLDNNALTGGYTTFIRNYDPGIKVTILAMSTNNGLYFSKWTVEGTDYSSKQISITMNKNIKATVVYTSSPPEISLNRTELYFAYILGSITPQTQSFIIYNSGGGVLNWSIADGPDVRCSPNSGRDDAIITVSIEPTGIPAGSYYADLEISASYASNSPQIVRVYLEVKDKSADQHPFGDFSTPIDGSTVRSSIPVTGWVVDDTGVESVKVYRKDNKNLVYIGEAFFVEGARPDIEETYPTFPASYKAGWGYMLLTLGLPNRGNGTYTLHAIATDTSGNQTTLGTKIITCDNVNAVKPFGAIDTPLQSGLASGNSFINWGWALTPQPNSISTDGSTIDVWVDGVNLGHPNYNIYRGDIASIFPGYANSNGAVGYFIMDLTTYSIGIHTINWTARDSGGNSDGIGSRYFTINNTQSSLSNNNDTSSILRPINSNSIELIPAVGNLDYYGLISRLSGLDGTVVCRFQTHELERIQLNLSQLIKENTSSSDRKTKVQKQQIFKGYLLVGDRLNPLPVGSTLDKQNGVFSWFPGPGFNGYYHLVFAAICADGNIKRKDIVVEIIPR